MKIRDETGLIDREIIIYKKLIENGFKVSFITYGDESDYQYQAKLMDIEIIPFYANVYWLAKSGYDSYGVDYARKTVDLIHRFMPKLKATCHDVRYINFNDNFFDGYWSLGVIEYFYEGYEEIVKEAKRVIKRDGFLFLSFLSMSILRRFKARLGLYVDYRKFLSICPK